MVMTIRPGLLASVTGRSPPSPANGLVNRGGKWERGGLDIADHKGALAGNDDLAGFWE
jgi:hypothetical protein